MAERNAGEIPGHIDPRAIELNRAQCHLEVQS